MASRAKKKARHRAAVGETPKTTTVPRRPVVEIPQHAPTATELRGRYVIAWAMLILCPSAEAGMRAGELVVTTEKQKAICPACGQCTSGVQLLGCPKQLSQPTALRMLVDPDQLHEDADLLIA